MPFAGNGLTEASTRVLRVGRCRSHLGEHEWSFLCVQLNTKAVIRKVQLFMLPWLWLMVVGNFPTFHAASLQRPLHSAHGSKTDCIAITRQTSPFRYRAGICKDVLLCFTAPRCFIQDKLMHKGVTQHLYHLHDGHLALQGHLQFCTLADRTGVTCRLML